MTEAVQVAERLQPYVEHIPTYTHYIQTEQTHMQYASNTYDSTIRQAHELKPHKQEDNRS